MAQRELHCDVTQRELHLHDLDGDGLPRQALLLALGGGAGRWNDLVVHALIHAVGVAQLAIPVQQARRVHLGEGREALRTW